jgi:hypothetical protein
VFIRGTNTKQWEVPKITRRNTKANIFQKRSAIVIIIIIIKENAEVISFHDLSILSPGMDPTVPRI